jgi:CheY-like chemotaxis protein
LVLVVGDNDVSRRLIVDSLNRHPLSAAGVDGPLRAMEELADARRRGTPYSLILLDVDTTLDHAEILAREIVRGGGTPNTPILLLSSSGDLKDLALWKELGLAAFLVTPVRQSDLIAVLSELLGIEPPAALPAPRRPGSSPARRARILLAESNIINQRVSQRLLASRGHTVTVVGSGGDALAAIANTVFDVVLIERQLPDMDAIEVAAAVRTLEPSQAEAVRIVALASHVVPGDRERCHAGGFDGYLRKPLDRQELFGAIEHAEWSGHTATASRVFLESGPELLLSIKTAIDVGDAIGVQQWAQKIKDAGEQFGAAGVVDAARALEILGRHRSLEGALEACQRLEAEIKRLMMALKDESSPAYLP